LPEREVSISQGGEILVRGATLFAGYVEDGTPDRPVDSDGWFHTGDLGELDENGFLRVLGRKDNMFVSGGENIQPEEIEEALSALSGVEAAVVVPVDDPEFGQRPVAFVRMEGEKTVDLAPGLEKILPRFKIPVAFYAWPEEGGGMKVNRVSFRERARLHADAATCSTHGADG
jgi:O-succinylbenzoic acid--CoA ligase